MPLQTQQAHPRMGTEKILGKRMQRMHHRVSSSRILWALWTMGLLSLASCCKSDPQTSGPRTSGPYDSCRDSSLHPWSCGRLRTRWLQFDGDPAHSGNNTSESLISASNVGTLVPLFDVVLPGVPDGAPAVLRGVPTANGKEDLIFVTTHEGHLLALDAKTGATVWMVQYGAGGCLGQNLPGQPCYTTSSPAIDPSRQFVYAYGLDGYVHKYMVGNGTEVTTGGWPELVTLKANWEKGSAPLVFATDASGTTFLYAMTSSFPGSEMGDYQGHVTAINLSTGAQKVFNSLCSDQTVHFVLAPGTPDCAVQQSGIWERVGVVYDAGSNRIYGTTGNGVFDPSLKYWGDTVFSLNPDGSGANGIPLDTYTPPNYQTLQTDQIDLGSAGPALLPGGGKYRRLAAQGGKEGIIRLLDLDNLSGQGGPGHVGGELSTSTLPQGGEVLTALATWANPADGSAWVFVANSNGIAGLTLQFDSTGTPSLVQKWLRTSGGTSPLIANNVLYYAGSGHLWALNPTTGAQLFDGSTVGPIHWQSPVVANGVVYIEDLNSHLHAFGLPASP